MLRVGLTGGLGCGKTTVARLLEAEGVHVAYADQIAREMMRPGNKVYEEVVNHFGGDIVDQNGSGNIDRRKLAEKAFSGGRVKELNRLVHPAVIARENEWMRRLAVTDPAGIAVLDAALIFEAGVEGRFDKIVVVTCDREQSVERFAARSGTGLDEARAEVERRAAAQIPNAEKIKAADFVIENTGTLAELKQKSQELLAMLKSWNSNVVRP